MHTFLRSNTEPETNPKSLVWYTVVILIFFLFLLRLIPFLSICKRSFHKPLTVLLCTALCSIGNFSRVFWRLLFKLYWILPLVFSDEMMNSLATMWMNFINGLRFRCSQLCNFLYCVYGTFVFATDNNLLFSLVLNVLV